MGKWNPCDHMPKRRYPITQKAVTGVGALHRTMVSEPKKKWS